MEENLPQEKQHTDKIFEDFIPEIEKLLNSRRHKWTLAGIQFMDYDDVKQIIFLHLFKKFKQYDFSQPFAPWCNTIITNQLKNLQRNFYYSCARPCVQGCCFNDGNDLCSHTPSGKQCSECKLYRRWELKKKSAHDIRLPLPEVNYQNEIYEMPETQFNLEKTIEHFHLEMQKVLKPLEYRIYYFLFVEKLSEEETAKKMGYFSKESNRKAGYNSILRLKKKVIEKSKKAMKNVDYY